MMTFETIAPYLFFALGVIGRVVVPYIQSRIANEGPLSFDWRYLVGQIIAAVVALIPIIAGSDFVAELGQLGWLGALLYGWGSGDIGRTVQKLAGK